MLTRSVLEILSERHAERPVDHLGGESDQYERQKYGRIA